jgi:hypothetical protein
LKVINKTTEQIIEVEDNHFVQVLSKQGWDELVLPTTVQEYIDAGGYVPVKEEKKVVKTQVRKTRKKATTKVNS